MDFDRRQFLSKFLDIPPHLFGIITLEDILKIMEQQRAKKINTPIVSTASATSHKLVVDTEEYSLLLTGSWTTFISNPAHRSIPDVLFKINVLYHELPHVRDKKPIEELLCRYHDFMANVLSDQRKYDAAIEHCQKALRFAQLLNNDELKALGFYELGYTLRTAGNDVSDRLDEALRNYGKARRYEQRLPSNLRGCLLLDTGRAAAVAAKTPEEKREAIALVDRVGNIVRSNQKEEDPYFLNLNLDRYHLTRSVSLIAVGRNRDAINEFRLVKAGPENPRRQAYNDIYQAQALVNLGEYEEAVELAESGLVVVQEINSEALIARVEKIYQSLKESPYKDNPDVARLEYLLGKR